MTERSVGINTQNADKWVASFDAAEQAEGHTRVIQIIGLTAGKIGTPVGAATRVVATDDPLDISSISGNLVIGDNSFLACYLRHTSDKGQCLITPLLCDDNGDVIGTLPPKRSTVAVPLLDGVDYVSNCLSWDIKGTGALKAYMHVSNLSNLNTISLWCFTF